MSIWALVPFKGAKGAKRRIGKALSAAEREGLVLAMLGDVLGALAESDVLAGVLLVSRDAAAPGLAREFGIDVFADSASDLSGAVAEASDYVRSRFGASGTLFVPGDVPLIQATDIGAVLDGHTQVTLVPDAVDVGTNAFACSPPNAAAYLFDGKSFKPHYAAAERTGLAPRVVRRAAFGIDVDTIAELAVVAKEAREGTRTATFLRTTGIAERLAACAQP